MSSNDRLGAKRKILNQSDKVQLKPKFKIPGSKTDNNKLREAVDALKSLKVDESILCVFMLFFIVFLNACRALQRKLM